VPGIYPGLIRVRKFWEQQSAASGKEASKKFAACARGTNSDASGSARPKSRKISRCFWGRCASYITGTAIQVDGRIGPGFLKHHISPDSRFISSSQGDSVGRFKLRQALPAREAPGSPDNANKSTMVSAGFHNNCFPRA